MTARRIGVAGLLLALAGIATAQIPFEILVTQGQNAVTVQNGSTLTFLAPVGQAQTAQIEATYTGTGQVTISAQPNVFGSLAFKATVTNTLPALLTPGQNLVMTVTFTPASAAATTAEINLPFIETLTERHIEQQLDHTRSRWNLAIISLKLRAAGQSERGAAAERGADSVSGDARREHCGGGA